MKNMQNSMERFILFIGFHFGICLAFFAVIQRPLFCLYNRNLYIGTISPKDLLQIYLHGWRTDLIVSSYLTAPALLLTWGGLHAQISDILWSLLIADSIICVTVALICLADTVLYHYWQYKIDKSVFNYLKSPKGAFASVSAGYIVKAVLFVLIIGCIFLAAILGIIDWYCSDITITNNITTHVMLAITGIFFSATFFVLIRGLGIRPNNPSIAYYSKENFYNHCALNPIYSLIYSLSLKDNFAKEFRFYDDSYCKEKMALLFPITGSPQINLFKCSKPNILLVIWESLSARYVESLNGMPGVTPHLNKLSEEGVLFTRCDAGSFRTDRGLVCLLSGYLGQPTTSIINYTRKLHHLPALPRSLKKAGYTTTAIHGGDLSIMHKSDYYLASGHDRLVSQKDLPKSAPTGKWGIHDEYMFSWLYDDIQEKAQQEISWFTTFQTLSSHEPFDVPYHRLDDKITNSFAYTDECFGHFVDRLKTTPAWDNILIICVGDHGANFGEPLSRSQYPHIPLLMLGGVVNNPMKIDTIMSQTDLAATLLGQLGLPHDEFIFSRDILADTYKLPFSFHTYNNGFLFRTPTGYTHYDNVAERSVEGANAQREEYGKIILQSLYTDLSNR